MKYVISRYNHDIDWISEYTDDYIIYDRSDRDDIKRDIPHTVVVDNAGSDLFDKLSYIIEHYDSLPDCAVYTKANIFKYITKEEFDKIKDNTTFTPILTKDHKVYADADGPVCFYDQQGMFNERNDFWYLNPHPAKFAPKFLEIFGMDKRLYNTFAPGSNYIIPKENILQHPKKLYEELRSYLAWDVYPGDAQLLERNLYYLFKDNSKINYA